MQSKVATIPLDATTRLCGMRSKLFLPGTRPELFLKGAASATDALSFDLEDSVLPARKSEARANVAEALRDPRILSSGKLIIVRINAFDTPYFDDDLAALAGCRIDAINLPMVETPKDLRKAIAAIARAEKAVGAVPCGILANIETPRSYRLAGEIATADARVTGLQIGYADLFEPFGIARSDALALHQVRLSVRLAAAEARIPAFDGALADISALERCKAECDDARRLGFAGKSCIHPSQIEIVNNAFQPSAAEISYAARVVAAMEDAEKNGNGADKVDGQMVDAPFVSSARVVLEQARRLGLLIPVATLIFTTNSPWMKQKPPLAGHRQDDNFLELALSVIKPFAGKALRRIGKL